MNIQLLLTTQRVYQYYLLRTDVLDWPVIDAGGNTLHAVCTVIDRLYFDRAAAEWLLLRQWGQIG